MSYRVLLGYVVLALVAIVFTGILGFALRIMTLDASSPPASANEDGYHVIKRGDALARIAAKTGVPVQDLVELNPEVDPLALVPGRRIRLSATARATPARASARRPRARRYTVRPGDSLSSIADRTGVPLYRLLELNDGIGREPLVPGKRIRLRR